MFPKVVVPFYGHANNGWRLSLLTKILSLTRLCQASKLSSQVSLNFQASSLSLCVNFSKKLPSPVNQNSPSPDTWSGSSSSTILQGGVWSFLASLQQESLGLI